VSKVEKLFASLKRLIEASPGPVAQDDSPPVDAVSSLVVEPAGPAPVETPTEAAALVEEAAFPSPEPSEEVGDPESAAPAGAGLVLRLETEREPAPTFEVTRSGATVGRGAENAIRLEDLSVSRRHARITYRQGAYWLSDLGSMGGTWVDGTRLNAARRVVAGQLIDIGVCRLTASFAADPAQSVTRKSASKPRSEVVEQARRRR